MSTASTNATSSGRRAPSPATSPSRGPRPGRASSVTSVPAGSGGSACPGARTTITRPTAGRSAATARDSSVPPSHGTAAFAAPIRADAPPASTTPAAGAVIPR